MLRIPRGDRYVSSDAHHCLAGLALVMPCSAHCQSMTMRLEQHCDASRQSLLHG